MLPQFLSSPLHLLLLLRQSPVVHVAPLLPGEGERAEPGPGRTMTGQNQDRAESDRKGPLVSDSRVSYMDVVVFLDFASVTLLLSD